MPKIEGLFDELAKRGGSDLHLGVGLPAARTRSRRARRAPRGRLGTRSSKRRSFELLSPLQRARLAGGSRTSTSRTRTRGPARFRANYFNKSSGLGGGLPSRCPTRVLTLAELGCPEVLWRSRRAALRSRPGDGSDAARASRRRSPRWSTTSTSTRACHILTIEDPIEFVHEPLRAQITQREVGTHAPSFAAAMRSGAARENPDVVLVGRAAHDGVDEARPAARELRRPRLRDRADERRRADASSAWSSTFPADEQPQVRGMLAESLVGRRRAAAPAHGRRQGPRGGSRDPRRFAGGVRDHPRGQDARSSPNVMQSGQAQGMQTMDMALERLLTQSKIAAEDALDRAVDREVFAQVIARVRPGSRRDPRLTPAPTRSDRARARSVRSSRRGSGS